VRKKSGFIDKNNPNPENAAQLVLFIRITILLYCGRVSFNVVICYDKEKIYIVSSKNKTRLNNKAMSIDYSFFIIAR